MLVGLIGNPNCGKTALYNALSGKNCRIGNWPGVTVERHESPCSIDQCHFTLVDIPGCYSLSAGHDQSLDEQLAIECIQNEPCDLYINVIDAANLQRNLYLTMQLKELASRMIVVLNMVDVAEQKHIIIDTEALSVALGLPVVPMVATQKVGIEALREQVVSQLNSEEMERQGPTAEHPALQEAYTAISGIVEGLPVRILSLIEGDPYEMRKLSTTQQQAVEVVVKDLSQQLDEDRDIIIADFRYQCIASITETVQSNEHTVKQSSIDKLAMHRIWGVPFFLVVMYLLFYTTMTVGGCFQDFFVSVSSLIFIDGSNTLLTQLGVAAWIKAGICQGMGQGIVTTASFIPVLFTMFFTIAALEDSGYMVRAAFVMDRLMRAIGLPGKSFVALVIGFGCNVPAIMATRSLNSMRERILTTMMIPFMSCNARLTIYAVFTAAFFKTGAHLVVFALYIIGIVVAILTGWLWRYNYFPGPVHALVMELPEYHRPQFMMLCKISWKRLRAFLLRAGRLIVPLSAILTWMSMIDIQGHAVDMNASILADIGRYLTVFFTPIGIHSNNWPATVGLISGIAAKEVVIGTLNTLYSQSSIITHTLYLSDFLSGLYQAVMTIPHNMAHLFNMGGSEVIDESSVGRLKYYFSDNTTAFSYLLFILLYFPCLSTMAVMIREVGRFWALASLFWATLVAYSVATLFYQLTHLQTIYHLLFTLAGVILAFTFFFLLLSRLIRYHSAPTTR